VQDVGVVRDATRCKSGGPQLKEGGARPSNNAKEVDERLVHAQLVCRQPLLVRLLLALEPRAQRRLQVGRHGDLQAGGGGAGG